MKRKILLQLVLPLLGLIALFSMLAFAPNSAQRHPALLEMSVILREADSSILSTTRQGMEQAAADLNVELRFLSPTADNSAEEQIQLLQREVEAGASAILLIPADRTSMADAVSAAAAKSSLVTLETDMTAQGARGCISVDNAAVGQILGQAALNGVSAGGTVLLLDSAGGDNGIREQLEAAAALLEAEDRQVLICRRTENLSADLTAALSSSPVQAIVAFEASALERAVEVAQSSDRFPLLYGTGSTSAIAAGLEENDVTAIVAHNAFSAGISGGAAYCRPCQKSVGVSTILSAFYCDPAGDHVSA